jgi:poly [ADP-ribose] polymerase
MGDYKYLINVSNKNNNKFYEMIEESNGTFTVNYGRVDVTKITLSYPMSLWDNKYKDKLKPAKGYEDITEYRSQEQPAVETKNSDGDSIISHDSHVAEIVSILQDYAKAHSAKVYNVKAVSVTQIQVDAAQVCIDTLTSLVKDSFGKKTGKNKWSINVFNTELMKLFRTIPRKMKNVNDHLITANTTADQINDMVSEEQSNLDSMASQVVAPTIINENEEVDTKADKDQKTLLETLGLHMELLTCPDELKKVKKNADEHKDRVTKVYKVVNNDTQTVFDTNLGKASNQDTKLFWHGSRNQNWWFIVQQGLKIRPSGAIHTGSMFGDGIYFAAEADKSMGYTDSGRWARGNSNGKVYMALYEVHVGNQYTIQSSDSGLSYKKIRSKGDYHSTWGKKGHSLYRHEFIIYQSHQSTIKYLVEFKD